MNITITIGGQHAVVGDQRAAREFMEAEFAAGFPPSHARGHPLTTAEAQALANPLGIEATPVFQRELHMTISFFVGLVIVRCHVPLRDTIHAKLNEISENPAAMAKLGDDGVDVAVSCFLEQCVPNKAPGTLAGDALAVVERQQLARQLVPDYKAPAHRPPDDELADLLFALDKIAADAGCDPRLPGNEMGRDTSPLLDFIRAVLNKAAERGLAMLRHRNDLDAKVRDRAKNAFKRYKNYTAAWNKVALAAAIRKARTGT
jgi:hypothetical protein